MRTKLIVTAGGALGYGVLLGWAFTADYYSRRVVVLGLLNEMLRQKCLDLSADAPDAPDDSPEFYVEDVEVVDDWETRFDVATEEMRSARVEELRDVVEPYTGTEDMTEIDPVLHAAVTVGRGPYVISRDEFAWGEETALFGKETLTYYPSLRALVDEDEESVDILDVIGWENLNRFGDESGMSDVVFVRNPRLLMDYEVVRDEDNEPPIHLRYALPKDEYQARVKSGQLRFRTTEDDGD